jgi:glycerophosphoryl diester phosphodiesterase
MQIFAHRGSSLIWPENTMLAFENADASGATGFETDLRLTRDRQIVLSHDNNLTRFGLPDVKIDQLTYDESRRIVIPSADSRYRDNLTSLATLLTAFPHKDYIFDCKIDDFLLFNDLKSLVNKHHLTNRIWFLTWSASADSYVRQLFPQYSCFPREKATYKWGLASIIGLGNKFEPENQLLALPPYYKKLRVFDKKQIDSIRSRGKTFVGYLINSRQTFDRCTACGVNIYLSDRPDLLSRLAKENISTAAS